MDLDSLSSSVVEQRRLRSRRRMLRRRGANYLIRSYAKRAASQGSQLPQLQKRPEQWANLHQHGGTADDHAEPHNSNRRFRNGNDLRHASATPRASPREREARAPVGSSRGEEEEGRELACSDIPLPSDHPRLVRTPTLGREGAFRYASTSKGKVRLRNATEDAQVAQLYHKGLLYDNGEQGPEEVFDLNSIQHDEPIYTIRPAKRPRQSKAGGIVDRPLHLNLSFTDLGDDNAIARYLMSPPSTPGPSGDESTEHSGGSAEAFPLLRVIYELDSSNQSFDVDTTQPPDLVADALSEYDYFAESDLDDDLPTQKEVRENANNPSSEIWVVLG